MDTIGQTNVHYIRCIKPNEAKVAWEFEPGMVLSQLRACGVLETIRISCAGYPSRWTFEEFAERYYALVPSKFWNGDDIRGLSSAILEKSITDESQYQVGKSKIFFRAGQVWQFINGQWAQLLIAFDCSWPIWKSFVQTSLMPVLHCCKSTCDDTFTARDMCICAIWL